VPGHEFSPIVHAIDLVANLEVLDIFADRGDDSRPLLAQSGHGTLINVRFRG
jgi:hypothetical protein